MKPTTLLLLDRAWGGPGRLPLHGSLRVLLQLMSELRQQHEGLGEIHGEISPGLIVLTEDSRVRLIPPASRMLRGDASPPRFPLHYLAPEKLRGEPIDARADVFSVGVLLWEALAGNPLLELTSREDILARWRADLAPLAPVRDPHLWARSLSHIAARALAIEPIRRYASIRQFQNALETLAGRHAANLDGWDALLKGPSSLPRLRAESHDKHSRLIGSVPRALPWQSDADDTVFDITARPPDLETDSELAALDAYRALPARALPDDEQPTRFMPRTPRPSSVAPAARPRHVTLTPPPRGALSNAALNSPPASVAPSNAVFTSPPARVVLRAPEPSPAAAVEPLPSTSRVPLRVPRDGASEGRAILILVVLVALGIGALSSQLALPSAAQPAKPAPAAAAPQARLAPVANTATSAPPIAASTPSIAVAPAQTQARAAEPSAVPAAQQPLSAPPSQPAKPDYGI